MDRLAAQYRFWTANASEITDTEWVEAALNGDRDSAAYILRECCRRLPDLAKHPVVQLLAGLGLGEIPLNQLQKQDLVKDVMKNFRAKIHRDEAYENFLKDNQSILRDDFFCHLESCFKRAVEQYDRPKRRRAKWLAIAFHLAWAKKDAEGKSDNQERNADITQSMQFIIDAYNNGSLQNGVQRFAAGDSGILPRSIERVIKLSGYVGGGPYITDCRGRLAAFIPDLINKLQSTVTTNDKADHRPRNIASCIYMECMKAKEAHLLTVITDLETDNHLGRHDEEIKRLQEYVGVLASYGAKERGEGNKGTGADGLEKVYSKDQHRLPAPQKHNHSNLEVETTLLPWPVAEAYALIEDDTVVAAPDTRKRLQQLERKTLAVCKEIPGCVDAKFVTQLYWHGYKYLDDEGCEKELVSSFHPPLWGRYKKALELTIASMVEAAKSTSTIDGADRL